MDLSIAQMMQLQQALFEPHKDKWHPMEPEYGKDFILYMIEEVGGSHRHSEKEGPRRSDGGPCRPGGVPE